METVYIVLLILLIVYIPIYIYVRKSDKAHEKGFVPYGPTVMIRTTWGLKLMDRLAKYRKFWHFMGAVSLVISFILMIGIVSILFIDLSVLPQAFGKTGMGIQYALAIPGLNPMLPIVYGIIGLVIAMVIHEMAHGIQSRANDIKVDSSGILYGVIPLGAFVEPNEEEIQKSSRKAKMHLYAAGITTNTIAAIVLFVLMFSCLSNCLTCDHYNNAAVYSMVSDTEAYDMDIPTSSIITTVDGTPYDADGFIGYIEGTATSSVIAPCNVEFLYKGDTFVKSMYLGACVSSVTSDSPASAMNLRKGDFVTAMATDDNNDGTPDTYTFIRSPTQFSDFMNTTHSGQMIFVTYCECTVNSDSTVTLSYHYDVPATLTSKGDIGFFGIATTISGMSFTTPEKMMKTGMDPFYGRTTLQERAMGLLAYIGLPFQGFSPVPESVVWWYDCNVMDDSVFWIIIWIIYWTFWLNIVLGISNALPAVPFDGGLLFVGAVDWMFEKCGMTDEEKRDRYVGKTCSVVSYTMIFVMVLVVVAIVI